MLARNETNCSADIPRATIAVRWSSRAIVLIRLSVKSCGEPSDLHPSDRAKDKLGIADLKEGSHAAEEAYS